MDSNTLKKRQGQFRLKLLSACLGAMVAEASLADSFASYQAEDAAYSGGTRVESNHAGYLGSGFLGGFTDNNKGAAAVNFFVYAPEAGDYDAAIRYANATGSTKTLALYLNDQYLRTVQFGAGAHWGDWKESSAPLSLPEGSHTLSLRFNSDTSGNINIDQLALTGDTPANGEVATLSTSAAVELEHTSLVGGTVLQSEHAGYHGGGYVGGYTDSNRGQAKSTFNLDATQSGTYTLKLLYANGTGANRTLTFNTPAGNYTLVLPATGGWANYGELSHSAHFDAGLSAVAYFYGEGDSGNVNLDAVSLSLDSVPDPEPDPEPEPEPDPDPQPDPDPVPAGTIDANGMQLTGGTALETEHSGYTGAGFVGGFTDANKGNAKATFAVDIAAEGYYAFTVRYANGTPTSQSLSLLGGTPATGQVAFASTGAWNQWGEVVITRWLDAGVQTLTLLMGASDSGNVNIDSVSVAQTEAPAPDPDPTPTPDPQPDPDPIEPTTPVGGADFQAEYGFFSGGAIKRSDINGFTGTGWVEQSNLQGSRVIFTVNAEATASQTVSFHYNNPTSQSKTAQLRIDGVVAGDVSFAPTNGLGSVAYTLPLQRGMGTVSLHAAASNAGGYLLDRVTLESGNALNNRGATVGYQTYEAEEASTNATVRGPSRVFHEMEAEASGRKAVRLDNAGDYVEFTLTEAANAMVLRASIPDTANGVGEDHVIAVYANGSKLADHQVSSRYSWVYGNYPYVSQPSQGSPQRYFDDSRIIFPQTLPAGSTLRLQVDSNSNAGWYDIDLVELELVEAPRPRPAGFVSVLDYGAVANDDVDDYNSILSAISAAQSAGTGVWIPAGRFTVRDRLNLANVTVVGAGPWYSIVKGQAGKGGFYATGGNVTVAHLMVEGDTFERDDAGDHAAFEGNFGQGSLLQNVWAEHTKVGLWTVSGTNGLLATQMRIRNTFADGVNLNKGILDTHITQSVIRNTGDDALAMWSQGEAVTRSAFINNTVHTPLLGNGAGIYGGTANEVRNNIFRDTLTGSAGIAIGTRFDPTPLTGTTIVDNCELIRTGGYEPNWATELPAIWIFADSLEITAPIRITSTDIIDSTYQAFLISWQKRVENVYIADVNINGTGSIVLEANAKGNAYLERVNATNVGAPTALWPEFYLQYGTDVIGL